MHGGKRSRPQNSLVTLANRLSIAAMDLLEVRGLFKAFAALRAVDSVNFSIREGELYGLLGPNGAGKTTTLSMIAGLLKPARRPQNSRFSRPLSSS